MDVLKVVDKIQKSTKVLYVADKGKKSCRSCAENDGKIFNIDDPDLPHLPIHPHCYCKYFSATEPQKDVSNDVERYIIVKNLKETSGLEEEKAFYLAEQIIKARSENTKIRGQKLFLLFNGRYLMSSDGKLLLDAISGQAVSESQTINKTTKWGEVEKTVERVFDYSYSRQGLANEGGIPTGLYYIETKEERSIRTSPLSHGLRSPSWGTYSWTLHPDEDTDTRHRSGFFIHGGSSFNTKGCIDLQRGDVKFQEYFASTNKSSIYIYVKYEKEKIKIQEKKTEIIYPALF